MTYLNEVYDVKDFNSNMPKPPIEELDVRINGYIWIEVKNAHYVPGRSMASFVGFFDHYSLSRDTYEWLLDNCDVSTVKLLFSTNKYNSDAINHAEERITHVGFSDSDDALRFKLSNDL